MTHRLELTGSVYIIKQLPPPPPPFFFPFPLSAVIALWNLFILRTSSWKVSSILTLSLADVSKNGHCHSLAKTSPSPLLTSLWLSKSDLRRRGRGREGKGKRRQRERERDNKRMSKKRGGSITRLIKETIKRWRWGNNINPKTNRSHKRYACHT